MRAITYSTYGPPDVLRIKDVPKPVPKDDEILIRVRAVEATKADIEMRNFKFAVNWFWLPLRIAAGVRRPRRQILGSYFAGEWSPLGKDVTEFCVGDQVFGAAGLGLVPMASMSHCPQATRSFAKPGNMSFEDAAAVPLGGLNALALYATRENPGRGPRSDKRCWR